MISNRQDKLLDAVPVAALNDSESQLLLGGVEPVVILPEQSMNELPGTLHVEIHGIPLPAELLFLVASRLSLKDLIMLSQVNYAFNRALKSAYFTHSLCVSIQGVVGDYTLHDIQSMLSGSFAERSIMQRLEKKAKCVSNADAICQSNGCFVVANVCQASASTVTFVGTICAVSNNLLAAGCGFPAAAEFALAAGFPAACGVFLGANVSWCVARNRISACKNNADDRLDQQKQIIESNSLLKDKMAIFGFFKNPERNLETITFYHKLNPSSQIPDVIKMEI